MRVTQKYNIGGVMKKIRLRKVGGSTTIAIPPSILASLSLSAGSEMQIEVIKGRVVLQPLAPQTRPTLADLLAQCDFSTPRTAEEQAEIDMWTNLPPVGREFGPPEGEARSIPAPRPKANTGRSS
jgi:antitoxin ChpS